MNKAIAFFKQEAVLCISALAAIVSTLFVPVTPLYLSYIDFKVLALLFCLMAVVAGFIKSGLFALLSNKLLSISKKPKAIALSLTLACFFSAMLVTNDVALISFVPLTIGIIGTKNQKNLIFIIVMETIAANLGSALTPIGNPQNLFLYSYYQLSIGEFLKIIAPLALFSLALIILTVLLKKYDSIDFSVEPKKIVVGRLSYLYLILFFLCILTVLHILDYRLCFLATIAALLIFDRQIFLKVDYSLLLTFVAFFIFVGNLSNIEQVKSAISLILNGREFILSLLFSQIISNVPCAIMLSGFTENYAPLLLGVNVGGLGTLVASLASLISFKLYAKSENSKKALYFKLFSVYNIIFLGILMVFVIFLL